MLPGWSRAEIGGKPADVFDPPGGPAGRWGLLYLHSNGCESLAANAAYTAELARHRLPCVAPWGGRSWWVDRVCPEFDPELTAERHLLRNVVPWMVGRWGLGPRGVGAAGVGMGGQGAVRLGLRHPDRFPVVASLAGEFDFHERWGEGSHLDEMYPTRERCRHDTAVLQLDPYKWPPHIYFACDPDDADWFRGNDRLHEKLAAYGVPHTFDGRTSAGGHSWAYFDRMAGPMIAFAADGLARESRRLI
jgi:S-formylglutathione hydrolase